ncbi:MAG: PocR ligand-binding domain-containing protein [Desulfuromonadales bacterium]|nr:PocR ligand-binding domain-containing protein [Desulfuromonadales bacterium]
MTNSIVQNKLRAILEPDGDIGELELSDIIDCEMLQSMLEDFYRITGMLGAVLDISGKVLVAVGWQDICTKFHRCHPDTLKNCIESDTVLTNDVQVGTYKHYRCKNNMWDMVTPLVVGGRHVGNVFIGQFFYEDETPDVELFREQARRYGFDEVEYLAALGRVPRFSREAADSGMQFYAKLTRMVSSLSYSSIKESRMLNERIHLEEQLRQSQKMEAVGQLAGGVAHDFNNILQVISGYGNLLLMDSTLDDRKKEQIDHILSASEKAAQLTKGLLAFSRRQVMTFTPVNLNDVIEHVKKFLVRVIGEDIHLKTIPSEITVKVCVDIGQMEQVLINLATNSRDAMQKGGLLTIETGFHSVEASNIHEAGSVEPGRYAVVTVSDTGSGMDQETCKRIFEPFYTTKEVGKGTGLGMAIVYGIVKQHNGFINVYSELGQGTTFRIYIPVYEDGQLEHAEKLDQIIQPLGGTETILLAEDDVGVRNLMVTVLTKFGYNVIQAVDGQDVVDTFAENMDRVSMILMDVIMPKKNGMEAYDEIILLKPNVKVLYSSGYTADFIQDRGVSEEGIELLMKPVQPMEMLRKVREILDR